MSLEATEQGQESQAMDAALAAIGESPMPESKEPAAPEVQEAPQWNGAEWKFSSGGREIIPESREKILTWASQGHNYSQRMGELNKTHAQRMAEAEARAAKAAELEEKYSPFAKVNEYAEKNPDWWQHVTKSFEERQALDQGIDPKLAQIVQPLQEKLSKLEQEALERQQIEEQQKQAAVEQQEDQALDGEIDAIRKQHPNIDLSAKDESGTTLEHRILVHCSENGIRSFRAGFRDYLHDQLVVHQGAQNRLQSVKTQQAQAKSGLLGTTQTPTKELKRVDTRKPWSDPDFSDIGAILQEHRQINGG